MLHLHHHFYKEITTPVPYFIVVDFLIHFIDLFIDLNNFTNFSFEVSDLQFIKIWMVQCQLNVRYSFGVLAPELCRTSADFVHLLMMQSAHAFFDLFPSHLSSSPSSFPYF